MKFCATRLSVRRRTFRRLAALVLFLSWSFVTIEDQLRQKRTLRFLLTPKPKSLSRIQNISYDPDNERAAFCAHRASHVSRTLAVQRSTRAQQILSRYSETGSTNGWTAEDIVSAFTASRSLTIVISQCKNDVAWIQKLQCNPRLRIIIYIKCEVAERFKQYHSECIHYHYLTVPEAKGPEGTLQHFVHENYHDLSDYTYFCKDNEQRGNAINAIPTNALRRLALGLVALGDDGGFVHTAQDPILNVSSTLYENAWSLLQAAFLGNTAYYNLTKVPNHMKRCGEIPGFRECHKHWWFRLMDSRNSRSPMTRILEYMTGVRHFVRDINFYSFFPAVRVDKEIQPDGGFLRDSRGFPYGWTDEIGPKSEKINDFCSVYERFTCLPCTNPWIPARSQFIVSRQRVQSVPKTEFQREKAGNLGEYFWGLIFNCFELYREHREGQHAYIRCVDA